MPHHSISTHPSLTYKINYNEIVLFLQSLIF
jgi:hypothetical protein